MGRTRSRSRRTLLLATTLAAALMLTARPVDAAGGADLRLLGTTHAALTADLDADGARELVRIRGDEPNPAARVIEVWDYVAGPGWQMTASSVLIAPHPEGGTGAALDGTRYASALLSWREGGRTRILLVVTPMVEGGAGGCCLTVSTVGTVGDRITIRPMPGADGAAERVSVLDADADGTDELLVAEPVDAAGTRHVRLLRWTGDAFASQRASIGRDDGPGLVSTIGETDGIPGEEALFNVFGGKSLLRVGTAGNGELIVEEASFTGADAAIEPWALGGVGGRVLAQVRNEVRAVDWPRGGGLTTEARRPAVPILALSILGQGGDAVLIEPLSPGIGGSEAPTSQVSDLGLNTVAKVPASEAARRIRRLAAIEVPALQGQTESLSPFVGPLPGGLGNGRRAYVSAGNLITLDANGTVAVQPMSSLTGLVPVGVAGPAGAWWVLADAFVGRPDAATMLVGGGSASVISLVPQQLVLEPEANDGRLSVELEGAVAVRGSDGEERLVVPDAGFRAGVAGPPGSRVIGIVDQWVVHEGVLPDESVSLALASRRRGDGDQPIEAAIVLIDPAGRAYSVHWEGEVRREQPELTASADTATFAPRATIRGRAPDGVTVTVDGQPVAFNAYGAFHAEVDAGIWPRQVVVAARDALGNETVRRLDVVGYVDYRGLPLVPIVALGTLAFGAILFIRTPRRREAPATTSGDARLEELDGD